MTRQNVTDGPREVMTRKCPTCGGDGIVYSEASAAIDVERRLRALAAGSRAQAFRVELADSIASALVGPGARRLLELEALTKKRFFLDGKPETHLDHFVVLSEGKLADLAPPAPVGEDAEVMLQLVEVDRYDGAAAVGKLDGLDVVVADAASLVGKRVKVRIERVLDGRAYAVAHPQDEGGARAADGGGRGREADAQAARAEGRSGREGIRAGRSEEPVAAEEPEAETEERPESRGRERRARRRQPGRAQATPPRRLQPRRRRGAARAAAASGRRRLRRPKGEDERQLEEPQPAVPRRSRPSRRAPSPSMFPARSSAARARPSPPTERPPSPSRGGGGAARAERGRGGA